MRQVSLVALYGQKPAELLELITECQKQIANILLDDFQPYDIAQVHATILGLEIVNGSEKFNRHFFQFRNEQKRMNYEGLLNFIRTGNLLPFQIQIGGFQNRDYPFTSRGQRPCDRSFSIQGDKVVIMGWPLRGKPLAKVPTSTVELLQESRIYPNVLDDFRRAAYKFNFLHKYYRELTDVDNDFYFRIGLLNPSALTPTIKQAIENTLKQFLSQIQPIIIEVTQSNLYVTSYEEETLPFDSTKFWSVNNPQLTPDLLTKIYE